MNEFDEWLDYAVSVNDNSQLKYYEVKFAVRDAPPGKHLYSHVLSLPQEAM